MTDASDRTLELGAGSVSTDAGTSAQYLSFLLAGEEYAVDILRVKEIRGWEGATPIPNMPPYVKGMINLRGAIVPIIDLRDRFKLPHQAYGPTTVVIVLQVRAGEKERTMGIVVDAVSEVHDVKHEGLRPTPDFGGAVDTAYIRGLATVDDKMVIILDIDALLAAGTLKPSTGS